MADADWVERLQETSARRIDQVLEVDRAISAVRGRARSPRGEVTVTAAVTGVPTGLELSDAALALSSRALAALVLSTVQQAAADAARQAQEVLSPVLGEGASSFLGARLSAEDVRALQEQRTALGGAL